ARAVDIRSTGRMVVTSVTGIPAWPIAPRVHASTTSASAMGRTTPAIERRLANNSSAMSAVMRGTSEVAEHGRPQLDLGHDGAGETQVEVVRAMRLGPALEPVHERGAALAARHRDVDGGG